MTAIPVPTDKPVETPAEREYRARTRAWAFYDWANSAFVMIMQSSLLPVYYSAIAGATLATAAIATQYWTLTGTIALLITAVLSPILGTLADISGNKKQLLTIGVGIGAVASIVMGLVPGEGNWLTISILFVIGFGGYQVANQFYEALLPHVARDEDVDAVSAQGYAIGYLGGGLLLLISMILLVIFGQSQFEMVSRISFVLVGLWWAVFTIPLLRRVPEPKVIASPDERRHAVASSFKRLGETFQHLRSFRDLFAFLLAYWLYNDGIGTIIATAAIYGTELGMGATSVLGALLLVQFVGIPFSLIFGRIPAPDEPRRAFYLAFIVWNLVVMPLVALGGVQALPQDITGIRQPNFVSDDAAFGTGIYRAGEDSLTLSGEWTVAPAADADNQPYAASTAADAVLRLPVRGEAVIIEYGAGPNYGEWGVFLDGEPLLLEEDDAPVPAVINANDEHIRYALTDEFPLPDTEPHTLEIRPLGDAPVQMSIASIQVPEPARASSIPTIIGLIIAVEIAGLVFAWLLGKPLFSALASTFNTKRGILLSLVVYTVIAIWGYFLDSVIEFWMLAWMVAIVQGGSQALSRSMYTVMVPKSKSGEFFGFFSISSKLSNLIGPVIFTVVIGIFGSSRPAVLSLIVLFVAGGLLLTRVNVEAGQKAAQEDDALTAREAGTA